MDLYEEILNDWEVIDLLHIEEDSDEENGQQVVRRKRRKIIKGKLLMEFTYI